MTDAAPEAFSFARLLLATITVTLLIGVLAMALKKMGEKGSLFQNYKNGEKRLSLVETLALDPRHRLALIKCDNKEHLLLLGQQSDSIVQTNIEPELTTSKEQSKEAIKQ